MQSWLLANGDPGHEETLRNLLLDQEVILVTQRGAYDAAGLAKHYPRLRGLVQRAYRAGRIRDVGIREKLNAIATKGRIVEQWDDEEERTIRVRYGLADLALSWLGVDRSEDKAEGSVRTRYAEVDGLRADQYPEEHRRYALQDPEDTLRIYIAQEAAGIYTATQELQAAADLALLRATANGMELNVAKVEELEAKVASELVPEKLDKLMSSGILRPGHDGRPAANGSQDHVDGCDRFGCDCAQLRPKRKGGVIVGYARKHAKDCDRPKCGCPPQMTQPQAPSVNTEKLHRRVLATCLAKKLQVSLSDKGQEVMGFESLPPAGWSQSGDPRLRHEKSGKPLYVSVAGDFLHELAAHDPVLYQYRHRKRLDKIRQFLAKCRAAIDAGYPRMHPGYDLLKETARTSSFGMKKGAVVGSEDAPVPSVQIQNVPNPPKVSREGLEFLDDLDVRQCFQPAEGMVYVNSDFGSLELVTTGQVTLDLFGFSRHAELLNSGRNCHTYLGANLMHRFGDGRSKEVQKFRAFRDVRSAVRKGDRIYLHDAFKKYASGTKAERKCFKRYRTTAKPVGLGFPGMLGARKMAYHIFPQYNLESTEAECKEFKELWLDSYPEMRQWAAHVSDTLRDPNNPGRYWYESWGGFRRVACTFNAAANGQSMQTPGAMAAKLALAMVDEEIHDPSFGSILCDRFRMNLFVHDEIGGETPDDDTAPHVAVRLGKIMEDALRVVCPDVAGTAEPVLTRVWCKDAEPVFDEEGFLRPWDPHLDG